MNIQPILSQIMEEARQAAQQVEAQARERALKIEEESLKRSAAMHETAKEDAGLEAGQAQDRARRLMELEDRKYALASRRALIDKAFEEALQKLHALPTAEMEQLALDLIAQNASGDEGLQAGDINDGFYTPAFIDKANQRLVSLGKAGQLKDTGSRVRGCCGVVLSSGKSLIHCTVEALIESGREGLEAKVAALLFENKAS